MSTANIKAVDTWDLSEFLDVLRQIAQDAGPAGDAPEAAAETRPAAAGDPLAGDR